MTAQSRIATFIPGLIFLFLSACVPARNECTAVDSFCSPFTANLLYTPKDRSRVVTKYILAADSGLSTVVMFGVDRDTGALTQLSSAAVGSNPQPAALYGNFYYVPNIGSNNVSMIAVGEDSLSSLGNQATNTGPTFVAAHPHNGRLYVANNAGLIEIFQVNADGTLTSQTTFNTGGGGTLNSIRFSAGGERAFVTDVPNNQLRQYTVNSDGTLTLTAQPTSGTQPSSIDLNYEETFAYVPSFGATDISVFDLRNAGLVLRHTVPLSATPTASFLSRYPGNLLFTSANGTNELFVHRVDHGTGNLNQINAVSGFNGIILARSGASGQFLFVSETLAGTISTYNLDQGSGTITLSSATTTLSNPSFFDFVNEVIEE